MADLGKPLRKLNSIQVVKLRSMQLQEFKKVRTFIMEPIIMFLTWRVEEDHGLCRVRQNSIAFGKSTSQRIYSKQRTHKIGKKRHKYGLKHALHTLDGHLK